MRNTDMGQPEMEMSQGNKLPDTPKDKKKENTRVKYELDNYYIQAISLYQESVIISIAYV